MFIWFNKNKLNYNKGQLAPVFIVVLVVLMIMAMVTVNLSKVASIKTDSSNAVDSSVLAGGSVMANVFNSLAVANADMEYAYWSFLAAISVSFVITGLALYSAYAQACPSPCSAAATIGTWFIPTTWAILIAVSAYWVAQNYYYLLLRRMAWQGRESAITIAHKFTFMNSGIGAKLKEEEPPQEITDPEKRRNYREVFSDFLDETIKDDEDTKGDIQLEYTYSWQDGEERAHRVTSQVRVDEVDTFDLRVTALPYPAELGFLIASLVVGYTVVAELAEACSCQIAYFGCIACCGPHSPGCCVCAAVAAACWIANCTAATATLVTLSYLRLAALGGLFSGPRITSSSGFDAAPFILCWIEDIEHNRRFRIDTDQYHEGADLGLWQTRYPDVHSYSIVDFRGRGKIYPPVPRHDASIIETDR